MNVSLRSDLASSHRARAAWIAGGAVGLFAAASLLLGVEMRAWRLASRPVVQQLFRWHDVAIILQSVLLIRFAGILTHAASSPRARLLSIAGPGALATIALLMLLYILRILTSGPADTLYMLPQGLLGIWVIIVSRRVQLGTPLRQLGILSGTGLLFIGISFVLAIVYFGPAALGGTIRDRAPVAQFVNRLSHVVLRVGSYAGRLGFPIWTLLVGRTYSPRN